MDNFAAALWLFADPYLIGLVFVGTVGGVIVGRVAGAQLDHGDRAAAAVHPDHGADPGDLAARGAVLRRHLWRLDHGDPGQRARRTAGGGHRVRRLSAGPAGPGRPGARHRHDLERDRRHRQRHRADHGSAAALAGRLRLRPAGVFRAGPVRPVDAGLDQRRGADQEPDWRRRSACCSPPSAWTSPPASTASPSASGSCPRASTSSP